MQLSAPGQQCQLGGLGAQCVADICSLLYRTLLKVNVFRMTAPYLEVSKKQDREFPIKRDINVNNYLCAIMDNKGYTQYNFKFGDKMS